MAMFNSNLTSSISGWFSNAFQPPNPDEAPKEENTEENVKQENVKEENVKEENVTEAKSDDKVEEQKTEEQIQPNEDAADVEEKKETAKPDGDAEPQEKEGSGLVLDKEQMQKKITEETQKMMQSAKTLGTYLFGVASEASKKVSSTVNETASSLKKTVEVLEEKTILGDLNREQKDFIQKKREKQGEGAVPPWVGYHEEETMKKQILALSSDSRNFLRSPPAGVQFQFDFVQMSPVAKATLKEDENLTKMRFHLVPTKIKEEIFWRNYFYRISLIKQSAQLSTLSEMQKTSLPDAGSSESSGSSIVVVGSTATGTMSRSSSSKSLTKPDAESANSKSPGKRTAESPDLTEASDDLPSAEFVSDAFDPSTLNPDDLEREMKELGMDEEKEGDGMQAWEHELQKELQDYEVVQGNDKDEIWEQEIESMLTSQDDSN